MNPSARCVLHLVQEIPIRKRTPCWHCFWAMKPHGESGHCRVFECETCGMEERVWIRDEIEIRDSVDRATRPEPHLAFPDPYNGERDGERKCTSLRTP